MARKSLKKQISMIDLPSKMSQTQLQLRTKLLQDLHVYPKSNPYADSPYKNSHQNRYIFDDDFQVQSMINPIKFIGDYGNEQHINSMKDWMILYQQYCGKLFVKLSTICGIFGIKCFVYELQTSSGLVQRYGKFSHLLTPGFNRINPCTQKVHQIDMRIKLLQTGHNTVITRDNIKLIIQTSIAFRITNPIVVYYKFRNELQHAIIQFVIASFRKVIGTHTLQDILSKRNTLIVQIIQDIKNSIIQGIYIQNIFLQNIEIPHQIQNGLSSVARQKRVSQANIINSKADVESAQLMRQSMKLLDTKAAMQIRYLDLVQQLGKRGATVIMDIGVNKRGFKDYSGDTYDGGQDKVKGQVCDNKGKKHSDQGIEEDFISNK